jgi:predicted outer membrane protein
MRDGIHIDAWVVRVAALLLLVALAFAVKSELPAARRYLKMELM